ncbi:MAG: hypothetical protein H6577_16865 [Lewinellaceae bacterium]|nr:hypothetical protein [Saprospiraceae bacterium]MCB9339798.1 hypothetical protein [Lewinellaceae bacterium]
MPWQELVKTALLGTEHSSLSEQTQQALRVQGIDVSKEAPLALLEGVALYGQMRKAGFQLENYTGELPKAVEPVGEKICSHKSSHHLHLILSGEYGEVLPEFIEHLLKNGKYLPPEHLPVLLRRPDARNWWEKLQPALSAGGRWLLAQHPDWGKWLEVSPKIDWGTGAREERLSLFRHLRKSSPATALNLLQSTWGEEGYRDKTAFLAEMEIGLSGQDEPFLECCLDDKRKEVRQVAARLLAKMVGSHLSKRMFRRATDILDWKAGKLTVNIPEEPDDEAIRDGIQKIHADWKGGAKAAYLGQLVAALEPDVWSVFFEKQLPDIMGMFVRSDWAGILVKAITEAALFHNNQKWLDGICAYWLETAASPHWDFQGINDLAKQVSPAAFNQISLRILKENNQLPAVSAPVFSLFQYNKAHWDDELGNLILSRFKNWVSTAKRQDWESLHYKEFLKMVALRSSPVLFDVYQKGWNTESHLWAAWEKPVEEMLNTLLFRKEMIAELSRI